jgi:hypothetical protein
MIVSFRSRSSSSNNNNYTFFHHIRRSQGVMDVAIPRICNHYGNDWLQLHPRSSSSSSNNNNNNNERTYGMLLLQQ